MICTLVSGGMDGCMYVNMYIAAIIWYLSGARDRDRTAFGVPDWSTYLSNANNLPEAIDTSDSETESIGSVIEE